MAAFWTVQTHSYVESIRPHRCDRDVKNTVYIMYSVENGVNELCILLHVLVVLLWACVHVDLTSS